MSQEPKRTPKELVQKMLDELDYDWENHDHEKTWIDPVCGVGDFLCELARRGVKAKNIYGIDISPENVQETQTKLKNILGRDEDTKYWINRNIVEGDALTFDFEGYWKETE
jgi:2-polyprenyl-3-methyl-5-hydroxy-6-metoxy-1,4-benzoquinol methylase